MFVEDSQHNDAQVVLTSVGIFLQHGLQVAPVGERHVTWIRETSKITKSLAIPGMPQWVFRINIYIIIYYYIWIIVNFELLSMAFQYFPVKYVGLPTSMIQATATRQQWQLAKLLASLTCGGFSASPRENTRGTPRKRIWKLSILTLLVMFGFHVQSRGQKKRNTHFGNGSNWVKLGYLKSWDGFILEIGLHYTKPILIKYGWLGLTLYMLDHFGPCQGPTTPLCLSNGWGVDNRHQKGWLGQHCAVEEAGVLARHMQVQALNSLAREWNNLHDVIIYAWNLTI